MTTGKRKTHQAIKYIQLSNRLGTVLEFANVGATWMSCRVVLKNGLAREVLLGCYDPWHNSDGYLGATVGRYANRIKNATFKSGEQVYSLVANQGKHQLHGGTAGFSQRAWHCLLQQSDRVIFAIVSDDNEQGFPGRVMVTVDYLLTADNRLVINYLAQTDKTTPINLTNHAYFNLDGQGDARAQKVYIDADKYLPVNSEGIPLRSLKPVEEGDMDLRSLRKITERFLESPVRQVTKGYDHAYLLNEGARQMAKPAAILRSADEKVEMKVYTNKPAIQLYTGNFLAGIKDRQGRAYQAYQGVALETEFLPDSPNRKWPHESCYLRPEQFYNYMTIYEFTTY